MPARVVARGRLPFAERPGGNAVVVNGAGLKAGAAGGAVAAMAMTAARRVTKDLGLLGRAPPEEIAEEGMPRLVARIPPDRRGAAVELAHWAYGAAGGALYAALPAALRRQMWSGPLYGLTHWAFFEGVVAPGLGRRRRAI
jgi:hypothetical protein